MALATSIVVHVRGGGAEMATLWKNLYDPQNCQKFGVEMYFSFRLYSNFQEFRMW